MCKELKDGQCKPNSDDNITAGESVTLSFNNPVNFGVDSFNDANHDSLDNNNTNTLLIGTDLATMAEYTFQNALTQSFDGIGSITFEYGGNNPTQFYLEAATVFESGNMTPVPLPGTSLLMLGALGGMAALRRRKRAA